MSLLTREPAPITTSSPIVTPGKMMLPSPMNTLLPTVISTEHVEARVLTSQHPNATVVRDKSNATCDRDMIAD